MLGHEQEDRDADSFARRLARSRVHHHPSEMLHHRDLRRAPVSSRRKAGDEASTAMMIRSLEDSLAHWCTIAPARCCTTVISAGHQ